MNNIKAIYTNPYNNNGGSVYDKLPRKIIRTFPTKGAKPNTYLIFRNLKLVEFKKGTYSKFINVII